MARRAERAEFGPVEFIEGSAEVIPLKDASVDTVVTMWWQDRLTPVWKRLAAAAISTARSER
jgi:hypothetical protein